MRLQDQVARLQTAVREATVCLDEARVCVDALRMKDARTVHKMDKLQRFNAAMRRAMETPVPALQPHASYGQVAAAQGLTGSDLWELGVLDNGPARYTDPAWAAYKEHAAPGAKAGDGGQPAA